MLKNKRRSAKEITDWAALQPGDSVVVSGEFLYTDAVLVEEVAPELGVMWVRNGGERKLLNIGDHKVRKTEPAW
jgi:hypothetical protein